jgi:hypothetical protein
MVHQAYRIAALIRPEEQQSICFFDDTAAAGIFDGPSPSLMGYPNRVSEEKNLA